MIDTISHDEAVIQHFIEDPELAEIMLEDAVAEGLKAIEGELGNAISDEAKIDLAIEMFKAENM